MTIEAGAKVNVIGMKSKARRKENRAEQQQFGAIDVSNAARVVAGASAHKAHEEPERINTGMEGEAHGATANHGTMNARRVGNAKVQQQMGGIPSTITAVVGSR